MKIAIFSDVFFPNVNGVVTSLAHLMEELSARGHHILLVVPSIEPRTPFVHKNVEVFYLPSVPAVLYPGVRTGLLSPRLLLKVKRFDPDVIHVVTPYTVGTMALLLSKLLGKPSIGIFHGYFMEPEYLKVVGITRGQKYVGSLIWQASKVFFDGCQVVVSPSEFVKTDLQKHGFKRPIVVCRNGLKPRHVKVSAKAQQEFKKKYHIQKDQVLMYVGRLSKEKNVETLLKVFAEVHKQLPAAQMVIVGGGPIKESLEQLAERLGVSKRVVFTGEIEHHLLLKSGAYELANVFVTCSTSEVQPMTIIEAMFAGLPLVIAKARGNIELVQGNGALVSAQQPLAFATKIVSILSDPAYQAKLSAASRKLAEQYTVQATADQYLTAYEKAIESGNGHHHQDFS